MPDLLFQQLSTVQSDKAPTPVTVASAATVAPSTFMTLVTGTTAIVTITPPVTGSHMLCLVFTAGTPTAFSVAGNVKNALAPTQNVPVFAVWNPTENKYYMK